MVAFTSTPLVSANINPIIKKSVLVDTSIVEKQATRINTYDFQQKDSSLKLFNGVFNQESLKSIAIQQSVLLDRDNSLDMDTTGILKSVNSLNYSQKLQIEKFISEVKVEVEKNNSTENLLEILKEKQEKYIPNSKLASQEISTQVVKINNSSRNSQKSNSTSFVNSNRRRSTQNDAELKRVEKIVNDLKIASVVFSTTAAVAAAAFWGTSWWFGITIPWAIAATAAAAALGAVSGAISFAITGYEEKKQSWHTVPYFFISGLDIGKGIARIVIPVLTASSVTVTATSWVLPALWAIPAIFVAVISWLSYYNIV